MSRVVGVAAVAIFAWYFTYWDYYGAISVVGPFSTYDVSAPALRAYEEATAAAQRAYDEARAAARRAYEKATAPARRAYGEATAPALAKAFAKDESS